MKSAKYYRHQRRKISKKNVEVEPTILIPDTFKPLIREELTHYAGDFACGRKEFALNEMRRRMRDLKRREGRT